MWISSFLGFPYFADFEIPCRSRALPRQRDAGEEAGEGEARGCAAVCLEGVSASPIMPAMPHERSGASLGKMNIRDLEILDILGVRDFEESEVPRIQKFLAVPVLCHGNVVRKRCARH